MNVDDKHSQLRNGPGNILRPVQNTPTEAPCTSPRCRNPSDAGLSSSVLSNDVVVIPWYFVLSNYIYAPDFTYFSSCQVTVHQMALPSWLFLTKSAERLNCVIGTSVRRCTSYPRKIVTDSHSTPRLNNVKNAVVPIGIPGKALERHSIFLRSWKGFQCVQLQTFTYAGNPTPDVPAPRQSTTDSSQ